MAVAIPEGLDLRAIRQGYDAGFPGFLETEVDAGPSQARRQTTAKPFEISAVFRIRRADYQTLFLPWWRDTLAGGVLWFDWTEPLSGAAVEARILGSAPPRAQPVAGGRVNLVCRLLVRPA
jgi:hypothetical protein